MSPIIVKDVKILGKVKGVSVFLNHSAYNQNGA